jgi:hypothetical protein
MDVNEADDLVRAHHSAVTEWALVRDASDRSGERRNLWELTLQRVERDRNKAAADLRRALLRAR